MRSHHGLLVPCALLLLVSNLQGSLIPVATYKFDNTLAADQGGVAALTSVDPSNASGFTTDTVYGSTRNVYNFAGTSPSKFQGGLAFNSSGLIATNSYSLELVYQFTQNDNAWRRIVDVADRSTDNGFYVNSSNHLDVYDAAAGTSFNTFTLSTYHHVVLTTASDNTTVAYLDGVQEFSINTNIMDIVSATNTINLFLDNTSGGGLNEWSPGNIALFRVYNGVLDANQVAQLAADPFGANLAISTPEPSGVVLMLSTAFVMMCSRQLRLAISRQAAFKRTRMA